MFYIYFTYFFFNSALYHFPFITGKLKKEVIPCAFSTIKKDYHTGAVRISTFKKTVPMPCSFMTIEYRTISDWNWKF